MSETVVEFSQGEDARFPKPRSGSNGSDEYDDSLDLEHEQRYSSVARCDSKEARDANARVQNSLVTEESQELNGQRNAQGSDDHVEACRRSRWFPYWPQIRMGSILTWVLDTMQWLALWTGLWWTWIRYYKESGQAVPGWIYFPGGLLVPLFAFTCATAAKGFGQHVATTRLTNPDSVDETIDRQVRFAGKATAVAGVLLLAVLAALFFAPPNWSSWVTYVAGIIGFAGNVALGLAAGVGHNAARLLMKPIKRDTLDCQLDMKRRLRRRLEKFLLGILLAVLTTTGTTWGATVDVLAESDAWSRVRGVTVTSVAEYRGAPLHHKVR